MPPPSPTRREAESKAGALPPLLLAAERIAASVQQGFHGRRQTGAGESFWQYRPYQPGDLPGRIDWRQSARGEGWQVRLQEWQAAQSLWLWRDASPSMRFSGHDSRPDKRYRAELLLLAIACLLLRAGERVGLLASRLSATWPPGGGQAALSRLAATLARQSNDTALDPAPLPQPLPRHSQALLFGDFLGDPAAIAASVKAYAAQGVRGALVQILDADEVTLPYRGRVRFVGLENEGALVVARSETLRSAYRQRLSAHQAALADLSRAIGWRMLIHSSDQSPLLVLAALYQILTAQGNERARR